MGYKNAGSDQKRQYISGAGADQGHHQQQGFAAVACGAGQGPTAAAPAGRGRGHQRPVGGAGLAAFEPLALKPRKICYVFDSFLRATAKGSKLIPPTRTSRLLAARKMPAPSA